MRDLLLASKVTWTAPSMYIGIGLNSIVKLQTVLPVRDYSFGELLSCVSQGKGHAGWGFAINLQ